jgi:alpha-1,3-rhamnosyl/mannosyltransferase
MPHYVLDARTATPHFPGIGRYVRNLARELVPLLAPAERLTVLVAPDHPVPLPETWQAETLPVAASPFSLRQQWVIPSLLRELQATLYHSAYYLMPYRPRVVSVLTLYDLIPMLFPGQSSWRARWLFRWMTALALRTSQHSIAISQSTYRDVLKHFAVPAGDITPIPLAADPMFGPQPAVQIAGLRRRYTLPEPFVLYVGRNKPHKNLVRLVEAWGRVEPRFPDHKLVVAGSWIEAYPESRTRAAQLGLGADRIRWLGPVPGADLPTLYAAATLFVFPSLHEGFGLPVVEAMACGTSVVCAEVASLSEVVGDAALRFDPRAVDAIGAVIARALSSRELRFELRRRGLVRAAGFSWTRTAQETLAVYRRLVRNG